MNAVLAIPFELRLVGLFLLGACVGCVVNWAAYRWALNPRPISPWSPAAKGQPPRSRRELVPIFGWLAAQKHSATLGPGYWIRPLAVELLTGLAFAALYAWEVDLGGLLPEALTPAALRAVEIQTTLHCQFLAHTLLLTLMIAASLIDLDDKIIPDEITLPGTLLGLALVTLLPSALLPAAVVPLPREQAEIVPLHATYSEPPANFADSSLGLYSGLAVVVGWWFALLPRHWRARHGLQRAWAIFIARIVRENISRLLTAIALVGGIIVAVIYHLGGPHWHGLFTGLIGLAASGGMIWGVRLVAGLVLRREAMGFGDVTLMAMIGSFLGWQACLAVFFLAPFAGLLIGGVQWLVRRENEIPYGPYLCLGAVAVVLGWSTIWQRIEPLFQQGWLIPLVGAFCLLGLAVLLGLLQLGKRMFR